jgi:hypothetical protein
MFSLIGCTSLSSKSLTLSCCFSGLSLSLSHSSLICSLVSSSLSFHVGDSRIDQCLGGSSGGFSSSTGLSSFGSLLFSCFFGSKGISLTFKSHLMK